MSCYTGVLFEEEILAECLFIWDKYVPYQRCIELVKNNQPKWWDPSDPPTASANDLHALIVEALDTEYENVKLYTALHSPLDRFHGVDCFVEFNSKIVTIDLTVNCHKDVYKADVILSESDIYDNEGKVNQIALRHRAKAIAMSLVS